MFANLLKKTISAIISFSLMLSLLTANATALFLTEKKRNEDCLTDVSDRKGLSGGRHDEVIYVREERYYTPRRSLAFISPSEQYIPTDKYGYRDLSERSSSESRQSFYEALYDFSSSFTTSLSDAAEQALGGRMLAVATSVDFSSLGLTREEALQTWVSFKNDNPEFYWISNVAALSDYVIYVIVSDEFAAGTARQTMNERISSKLGEYEALSDENNTVLEKVLAIHDKLCTEVGYAAENGVPSESNRAHSIVGALIDGSAVCEGYAKSFALILSCFGIENIYVTGESMSDGQTREAHSWNLVKLDDYEWHWIDTTWDATAISGEVAHYYFAKGNTAFSATHEPYSSQMSGVSFLYDLPQASETGIVPSMLYKNGTEYGAFPSVSSALEQTDNVNEWKIKSVRYADALRLDIDEVSNPVAFEGNYYDLSAELGEGAFSVDRIILSEDVSFLDNAEFTDFRIECENNAEIVTENQSEIKLSGRYCKLSAKINSPSGCVSFSALRTVLQSEVVADTVVLATAGFYAGTNGIVSREACIEGNITTINQRFFQQFSGIKSIRLSERINFISSLAFEALTELESIEVNVNNAVYLSQDGVLFKKDEHGSPFMLSKYPQAKPGESYILPSFVRTFEDNAFAGNSELVSLVLDVGVLSIGQRTFAFTGLETIYVPSTVSAIGGNAFEGSNELTVYCKADTEIHTYCVQNEVNFALTDEFTYTFLAEDGRTVLKTLKTYENTEIIPPEAPAKQGTTYSTFEFSGFSGFSDGMILSQDEIFTAEYREILNKYRYRFLNEDGSLAYDGDTPLEGMLDYGGTVPLPSYIPEKDSTDEYSYTFVGWENYNDELFVITQDVDFTACFTEQRRRYTYTFYDKYGNILLTDTIEYGSVIPLPDYQPEAERTDDKVILFGGWENYAENLTITCDIDFYPEFEEKDRYYTYTFYDAEGNGLVSGELEYGDIIPVPSQAPEKASTEQYDYMFLGWSGITSEETAITENIDIYPQYSEALRNYTYTFYSADGEIIATDTQPYNSIIYAPDIMPEKASTDELMYHFAGWSGFDGESVLLTGNTDFYPLFDEEIRKYNVIFRNYDGEELFSGLLEYGSEIIPPEAPSKASTDTERYIFDGFSGFEAGMTVAGNSEFTATFVSEARTYTYRFYIASENGENTLYAEDTVMYLSEIPEINAPCDFVFAGKTYVFSHWSGYTSGMRIEDNCEFVAEYDIFDAPCKYTFADWDGAVLKSGTVEAGSAVEAPTMLQREATAEFSYEFIGFTGYYDGVTITEDVVFTAEYSKTVNTYEIVFCYDDGVTVIDRKILPYGAEIVFPTASKKKTAEFTYEFCGYDGFEQGMTVNGDMSFTAVFHQTVNKYTYTFYADDGKTVLKSATEPYGTIIEAPTASKKKTQEYSYIFSGFEGFTAGKMLTENVTYRAVFSAVKNEYTYTFKGANGEIIASGKLPYGESVPLPAEIPQKQRTAEFTYTFDCYEGYYDGFIITENKAFNAVFAETVNRYTYRFYKEDGKTLIDEFEADYNTEINPIVFVKPDDERYIYSEAEWQGYYDGMRLTCDICFTAVIAKTPKKYECLFLTHNNEVIEAAEYEYGDRIILPEAPNRKGYEFSFWEGYSSGMCISGSISFKANYIRTENNIIIEYPIADVQGFASITSVPEGLTVGEFVSGLGNTLPVAIRDRDGSTVTDETQPVCTGMSAVLFDDDGSVIDERDIGVRFDLNGDGRATLTDIIIAQRACMDGNEPSRDALLALDIDNDGKIELSEFLLVRKYISER